MQLLFLLSLAAFAASQSLDDRIEATFKLCCLRNGVPQEVAAAMCTYSPLQSREIGKDSQYICYLAKYIQYVAPIKYCQIDATGIHECVKAQGITPEEEVCSRNTDTGAPVDTRYLMQNAEQFNSCWRGDLWYKTLECARDSVLSRGGHRKVFQNTVDHDVPGICVMDKKTILQRRVFLKLCEKSHGIDFYSDADEEAESACMN